MPAWWVSEPNINLRLEDEPLGYQPALGPRVACRLSYRQRGVLPEDPAVFGVGPNWSCAFRAFVGAISGTPGLFFLHCGGAGYIYYTNGVTQARDGSILTTNANGCQIAYPDGSVNSFQLPFLNSQGYSLYFLCFRTDPAGNTLTFNYLTNATGVQLTSIADPDGKLTKLYYTNATFTNLITQVTDPFNRTARLYYNASGCLTNITDVAQISSTLTYDAGNPGWITNLSVPPYGQTGFRFGGVDATSPTFYTISNQVNRFVEITLPTGGQHLYLYRQDCSSLIPTNYPEADEPGTGYLPNTLDNVDQCNRNSFHWNPLQHANLSTNYLESGQPSNLTTNDYNLALMRHWLMDPYGGNPSDALSLERAPSPDTGGLITGQFTWYDYAGKPQDANNYQGSTEFPSFVARVMPDGTSWFRNFQRNTYGSPTHTIEQWVNAAVSDFRTNTYVYATNAIDLLAVTNALGINVLSNAFNAHHQVTNSYDAWNQLTSYTYDGSNRLWTVTAPSGLFTSNYYGSDLFLASTADLNVRTNSYTWTNGLVATHTDERGLIVTNFWDPLQRLLATLWPDGTTLSNSYTALDLTATTDRLGFWTHYSYNGIRQKVAETNAIKTVTAYDYCECGALQYLTNAWGVAGVQAVTQFSYDNQGHVIQAAYPDSTVVSSTYDSLGRLTSVYDGVGTTSYTYDNLGRLTAVTNAFGQVKALAYDALDRITSSTDANGVTVTISYDALDRLLSRSYPDTGTERFAYATNVSSPTGYTNQITNVVLYAYDSLGRKTNETYLGAMVTNRFTYDGSGNLLTLIDGKNQATTWRYDVYSRVTNKVDALGTNAFFYQYDANSRLTARTNASGFWAAYGYDAVGNLTNIVYSRNHAINLAYDALSRPTNMVDAVGATAYSYDGVGQGPERERPVDG